MGTRIELQSKLEELLGSSEVYYNRPENRLMKYPAIVYTRTAPKIIKAENQIYKRDNKYELTVINSRPDSPVIDQILHLPYCSYDRSYKSDNLYHDTFTLYF